MAGVEASNVISKAGFHVTLCEMKPERFSPAHSSADLAELVCSNSLKALRVSSASGLLKAEMETLGSICVESAKQCAVPAGGALAVDRESFSRIITEKITNDPLIDVVRGEVTEIPDKRPVIIAAGPLASDSLAKSIGEKCGGFLSFFDAAAPIVTKDSIDMESAFFASRYDKGGDDGYINCPLDKEEYEAFYNELIHAERAEIHDFDKKGNVYEGCMPIEIMASRGPDTIRFGPLKPVGLRDPRTGKRPWAVLQLRRENAEGTLYNLVGFQTNLKFGEQKRVFSMFPALKNAEFARYGVMHRNTFINSPKVLTENFSMKDDPDVFFAGQITGVEGYMESASSGIIAGINAVLRMKGLPSFVPPPETIIGELCRHVAFSVSDSFQPMGANFGMLPPYGERIRDKRLRYEALAERSLSLLRTEASELKESLGISG